MHTFLHQWCHYINDFLAGQTSTNRYTSVCLPLTYNSITGCNARFFFIPQGLARGQVKCSAQSTCRISGLSVQAQPHRSGPKACHTWKWFHCAAHGWHVSSHWYATWRSHHRFWELLRPHPHQHPIQSCHLRWNRSLFLNGTLVTVVFIEKLARASILEFI